MLLALSSLLAVGAGAISHDYAIPRDVMGSGGQLATSGNYATESTLGQTIIGGNTSADYALCSGFWCVGPEITVVYSFTFGAIGIIGASLILAMQLAARWVYSLTRRGWNDNRRNYAPIR